MGVFGRESLSCFVVARGGGVAGSVAGGGDYARGGVGRAVDDVEGAGESSFAFGREHVYGGGGGEARGGIFDGGGGGASVESARVVRLNLALSVVQTLHVSISCHFRVTEHLYVRRRGLWHFGRERAAGDSLHSFRPPSLPPWRQGRAPKPVAS